MKTLKNYKESFRKYWGFAPDETPMGWACLRRPGVDIHHLSPQELADVNNYIRNFHKNHKANLANVCKPCHEEITKNGIIHRKMKTTEGFKYLEQ